MRLLRLALVLSTLTLLAVASPGTAQAAGCVHVHKIVYNSPGVDDGSNKSLNGEFARIHNVCSRDISLHGWKLRDSDGNVYSAFAHFVMKGGTFVDIHSGKGQNTATDRFWDRQGYVWNNSSDSATLKNANGVTQSHCTYDDPDKSATLC